MLYGDGLESQGFSFFTAVKISTTIDGELIIESQIFEDAQGCFLEFSSQWELDVQSPNVDVLQEKQNWE